MSLDDNDSIDKVEFIHSMYVKMEDGRMNVEETEGLVIAENAPQNHEEWKPSFTAFAVACFLLVVGRFPGRRERWLPKGCWEAQLEFLKTAGLIKRPWLCLLNPLSSFFMECVLWLAKGKKSLEALGFRKRYMEEQMREAMTTEGIDQVLILGAGYDTLAYRLCREFPSVNFWEVDHPATGVVKEQALEKMFLQGIPANFHTHHVDFSNQHGKLVEELLLSGPFDQSKPTIVVMEALLIYLDESTVLDLFRQMSFCCHDIYHSSRILMTHTIRERRTWGCLTGLFQWFLRSKGEDAARWTLDMEELDEFLHEKTGWTIVPEKTQSIIPSQRLLTLQMQHEEV